MKKLLATLVVLSAMLVGGTAIHAQESDFNAQIVTVANTSSYLAIDGKNLDSNIVVLALDGQSVPFSKVSTDGKIIKSEFDGTHQSAVLTLANGKKVRKSISSIYSDFPYQADPNPLAPDLVWGHVSIAVWDFHSVAKDENGNELTLPKQTTFDVTGPTKIASNSTTLSAVESDPITELSEFQGHSFVVESGKDLVLAYNLNNSAERKAYARLYRITNKDGKSLKFKRQREDKFAQIIIPQDGNPTLAKAKKMDLKLNYHGLKTKTLQLSFASTTPTVEPVNINPGEKIGSNVYDYGKDIAIPFDLNKKDDRMAFSRLYSITRVYDKGHEERLSFRRSHSGKDGEIVISFGNSRPLQSRGPITLKFNYRGMKSKTQEILYKDKAPIIELNSNNGDYETNKSLLFTMKNFEYMFQQNTGVKEVWVNGVRLHRHYVPNNDENLNDLIAKGVDAIENEEGNPYHVVQDLLRIKNKGIKALRPGVNYITVKYDTYHDSTLKFVLSSKEEPKATKPSKRTRRALRYDVMSSATSGGGGSASVSVGGGAKGDNSGSGSVTMGATVVYDFDMVANAKIVESLGYQNSSAKSTLDFWEGTAKEVAIFKNNPNRRVVWDSYMNYVRNAALNQHQYKSFNSYYNDPAVDTTKNAPYQLKYYVGAGLGKPILGLDNLLENHLEKTAIPKASLEQLDHVRVRTEIVLPLDKWTSAIQKITLGNAVLEEGKDYKVNHRDNTFVLLGKNFTRQGNYALKVEANGYETLERTLLVRLEKNEASEITLKYDRYTKQTIFTGDNLYFEIGNPGDVRVTGILMSVNDGTAEELQVGKDYSYTSYLGLLNINGAKVKQPGKYNVRFYLAGRAYKDVSFEVIGPEISAVKAPISDASAIRLNGNIYSFSIENYTGNREILSWLDNITEVKVNGQVVPLGYDTKLPLSYTIQRDQDLTFDAGSRIYISGNYHNPLAKPNTNDNTVKVEIAAKDYATIVFDYTMEDYQPLSNRSIKMTQVNPETGEAINELYSKTDYLPKEEIQLEAPFDEKALQEQFPGMSLSAKTRMHLLGNDGQFADYNNWLNNIKLIEINGERVSFGTTGALIDYYSTKRFVRIFKPVQKYDVITVYSNGYEPYQYFVH